jgi:CysZ protein
MSSMGQRFARGFLAPFRGFFLIMGSRRLMMFALMPFLLGAVLLFYGFYLAWQYVPFLVEHILLWFSLTAALYVQIAYGVALFLIWPMVIVSLFFFSFMIIKLLSAPFYSLLAERTLEELGARPSQGFTLGRWLIVSVRMFVISLFELVLFLALGIFLLVLSIIPGVNILSTFGYFLIIAFDSMDYAFEVQRMGLTARFRFFMTYFVEFTGLAVSFSLVFLLPGLNFFLFPAAVVGATDLLVRIRNDRRPLTRQG